MEKDLRYPLGRLQIREESLSQEHRVALIRRWKGLPRVSETRLGGDLENSKSSPIELALTLVDSLHRRWVVLLRFLSPDQFLRTSDHPRMAVRDLDLLLNFYACHGRHHSAQIQSAVQGGFR